MRTNLINFKIKVITIYLNSTASSSMIGEIVNFTLIINKPRKISLDFVVTLEYGDETYKNINISDKRNWSTNATHDSWHRYTKNGSYALKLLIPSLNFSKILLKKIEILGIFYSLNLNYFNCV